MTDARGSQQLPSFERPPVAEVVLAVAFERSTVLPLRLGRLYDDVLKPDGFTEVEERHPYTPPIEAFDGQWLPRVRLSVAEIPPFPRFWFSNASGSQLVQVQPDWFARNWRRVPTEPAYPRYGSLRASFEAHLRELQEVTGHTIRATQCEVTYVNLIEGEGVWQNVGDVDRVTSMVRQPETFLPAAERVDVAAQFLMTATGAATPVGRLHIELTPRANIDTSQQVLALNLTARGQPIGDDGVE